MYTNGSTCLILLPSSAAFSNLIKRMWLMLNYDYDLLPSSPRLPTQSLQSGSQSMWQAAFFSVVMVQPCRYFTARGARIYRPSFRENKPKLLVFSHTKRAFWTCFRENWVYNFDHRKESYRKVSFIYSKIVWKFCLYSQICCSLFSQQRSVLRCLNQIRMVQNTKLKN